MKHFYSILSILALVLLAGCSAEEATVTPTAAPTVEATIAPTATIEPTEVPTVESPTMETYTSQAGEFTISYPSSATVYEDQRPSVDGVLADAPDSVSIQTEGGNSFVLTIAFYDIESDTTLAEFISTHNSCTDVSVDSGTDGTLSGGTARLYANTLCGPVGTSYLYYVQGTMGYQFDVESAGGYQELEPVLQPMLDSFTSTAAQAVGEPTPDVCTVTADADVALYQRPDTVAAEFGTLTGGESVRATMRTDDGWLGFDPGVAQAANVGVFRMRWVGPDAMVTRQGNCDGLPVAPPISPTACYFMAMADTDIYAGPDETAAVLVTIPTEGYAAVTGHSASGWYRLDLQDSSTTEPGTGWLRPADANFNGPCSSLPEVTP